MRRGHGVQRKKALTSGEADGDDDVSRACLEVHVETGAALSDLDGLELDELMQRLALARRVAAYRREQLAAAIALAFNGRNGSNE